MLQYYRVRRFGHTANARIIDFKENGSGDDFCYLAIVSFTTAAGEKVVATAKEGNYIKPVINLEVPITYDSRHPSHFYFNNHSITAFYFVLPLLFSAGTVLSVFLFLQLI